MSSKFSPELLLSRLPDGASLTPQVESGITVCQYRDVLLAFWSSGMGVYRDGCKLFAPIRDDDTVDTVWARLIEQETGYRHKGRPPVRAMDAQLTAEPVSDEVDDLLAWFAS